MVVSVCVVLDVYVGLRFSDSCVFHALFLHSTSVFLRNIIWEGGYITIGYEEVCLYFVMKGIDRRDEKVANYCSGTKPSPEREIGKE